MLFAAKFSQALFATIDHMNRSEHRRNALPVHVFFFFCQSSGCPPIEIVLLAMFQDRCGICQFVPLDHRLPDLQLLHFSPPFLFTVLSITVPSPTHLLLRFFTKFQVLFSLLSTNIPSTSSPFLLFHLFISIFFFYISLFLSFFFVSICRSHFAHLLRIFFFTRRKSFFRLVRKKSRRF